MIAKVSLTWVPFEFLGDLRSFWRVTFGIMIRSFFKNNNMVFRDIKEQIETYARNLAKEYL